MSEDAHLAFVMEISQIMQNLKPDGNQPEFYYTTQNNQEEYIDLLVQIGSVLIIFECKLNRISKDLLNS